MTQQQDVDPVFGPVIYAYTRAQAIDDGVLVDASALAQEAGIRYPVAVTRGLWERHITVPPRRRGSRASLDGCGTCSGCSAWLRAAAAARLSSP